MPRRARPAARRDRRALLAGLALATTMAGAGCQTQAPPAYDPDPAGPTAGVTESVPGTPAAARATVQDALAFMAARRTGSYELRVASGDEALEERGSYRLLPDEFTSVRYGATDDTTYGVQLLDSGGVSYLRLPGQTQLSRCWLRGDVAAVTQPAGIDIDLVGSGRHLPAAVLVAATTRALVFAGETRNRMVGSVDFARATGLIRSRAPRLLGLRPGRVRVRATMLVSDGALAGIQILAADLNAAAVRAGLPRGSRTFAANSIIEITFDDVGEPVEVQAPPRARQLRLDGALDLRSGSRAPCVEPRERPSILP